MDTQHDIDFAHKATSNENGNNNGQMATGGFVIQVGAINGGQVNLGPAQSLPVEDPTWPAPAVERDALLALRHALNQGFGEEDLRDLAFELAIDYDDLPGATRKAKARELVLHCRRHERLAELRQAILQQRPGAL